MDRRCGRVLQTIRAAVLIKEILWLDWRHRNDNIPERRSLSMMKRAPDMAGRGDEAV